MVSTGISERNEPMFGLFLKSLRCADVPKHTRRFMSMYYKDEWLLNRCRNIPTAQLGQTRRGSPNQVEADSLLSAERGALAVTIES